MWVLKNWTVLGWGTVGTEKGGKREETEEQGRWKCEHNYVHCGGTATRSEGVGKGGIREELLVLKRTVSMAIVPGATFILEVSEWEVSMTHWKSGHPPCSYCWDVAPTYSPSWWASPYNWPWYRCFWLSWRCSATISFVKSSRSVAEEWLRLLFGLGIPYRWIESVSYLLLAVPSCLKVVLMNYNSKWSLSPSHEDMASYIKIEKMACMLEG